MNKEDIITRRYIASILGLLGIIVLIDIVVIAILQPEAPLDGFRHILFLIIGALLVCGGAITFAWPDKGNIKTSEEEKDG